MFAIIEIHSGETVKVDATGESGMDGSDPAVFDTGEEAQAYAIERFGHDAGKEYVVVPTDEIP